MEAEDKLEFDIGPLVPDKQAVLGGSYISHKGRIAIRKPTSGEVIDLFECWFTPYILNDGKAYLEIHVKESIFSKPQRFTTLSLSECDSVTVECDQLRYLPDVSARWSPLVNLTVTPAKRVSGVIAPIKKSPSPNTKKLIVLNIHLRGVRAFEQKWYGNRYEDMDDDARTFLNHFRTNMRLELDIFIAGPEHYFKAGVPKFRKICHAIPGKRGAAGSTEEPAAKKQKKAMEKKEQPKRRCKA